MHLRCSFSKLEKGCDKVFPYPMTTATLDGPIPSIQADARQITCRQLEEWFRWMDGILDVHRNRFVFRNPTADELAEHKTVLKQAIRTCHLILALVADPDFNEPELVSRLQVRIRQLQDAYDTFHDATLSDAAVAAEES